MATLEDVLSRTIRAEGFKLNEAILMSIAELADTVEDENADMETEDAEADGVEDKDDD